MMKEIANDALNTVRFEDFIVPTYIDNLKMLRAGVKLFLLLT